MENLLFILLILNIVAIIILVFLIFAFLQLRKSMQQEMIFLENVRRRVASIGTDPDRMRAYLKDTNFDIK
jgi:hypothetical protein